MKNNENGRSMIEMLGVLAIIGVLSVGGIAGYSKAMSKYRVNKTIDQVSHIAANTRILYGSQRSYDGLTDDVIYKAKLFPQEAMAKNDDGTTYKFTNPFAGGISMAPAARFTSGDNKAFVLKYTGIPQDACIDLATIDWGTGSGGGLVALGVGKKNGTANDITDKITSNDDTNADKCTSSGGIVCGGDSVMSVADAVTACTDVNDNTLYFKFY